VRAVAPQEELDRTVNAIKNAISTRLALQHIFTRARSHRAQVTRVSRAVSHHVATLRGAAQFTVHPGPQTGSRVCRSHSVGERRWRQKRKEANIKQTNKQTNKQTQRRYLKSSIPAFQALSLGAVGNLRRRKEKRITVASGSSRQQQLGRHGTSSSLKKNWP
jgi:hypothetical protein